MMGSIVPTGLGTDNPRTYGFLGTYNYTGGSGTLNDNLIGTGISNTELFFYEDPTVITLYLEEYASINSIELYSFNQQLNYNTGVLMGTSVQINDQQRYFSSEGFGSPYPGSNWLLPHERINLMGSNLENQVTNKVVLFGLHTGSDHYCISEIVVDGNPIQDSNSVPEASTLLLLGSGLAGLGLLRKKIEKLGSILLQ